jgi:hypothetical protein
LRDELANINWEFLLEIDDINDLYDGIKQKIDPLIEPHFKLITHKDKKQFIDPEIRKLVRQKRKLSSEFNKKGDIQSWKLYKQISIKLHSLFVKFESKKLIPT